MEAKTYLEMTEDLKKQVEDFKKTLRERGQLTGGRLALADDIRNSIHLLEIDLVKADNKPAGDPPD